MSTAWEPQLCPPGAVLKAWDTENFGFPVHEVLGSVATEAELLPVLRWCRASESRLVYWSSDEVEVSGATLLEYAGALVDRKTTFSRPIDGSGVGREGSVVVREAPVGPASGALIRLGLESGTFSRFRVDPQFPRELFELLYRTWADRSARHELADVVLLAGVGGCDLAGMITVSVHGGRGEIGLLSVDPGQRGRGVGQTLLGAADRWMYEAGATEARVVTQGRNRAACSLYERPDFSRSGEFHRCEPFAGAETACFRRRSGRT